MFNLNLSAWKGASAYLKKVQTKTQQTKIFIPGMKIVWKFLFHKFAFVELSFAESHDFLLVLLWRWLDNDPRTFILNSF